ncbi:MAG: histidine kinase, partial [Pedosphaera sp.]|nr:histidine kinase [Pedosphaera sp.]
EERDGIFLGASDTPDNENNKRLFTAGCQRILCLISLAAEKDWPHAAAATRLQRFVNPPSTNEAWLRSQIRTLLIEGFRAAALLRTISGKLIPPNSAWVPVAQKAAASLDLWQVTERLLKAADLLPRLQDQPAWDNSVNSWVPFLETPDSLKEIWTVDRLAGLLEGLQSITGVIAALAKETAPLAWINQVHALICKAEAFDSFRQRSLIPNECGHLTPVGKLHRDGNIDQELKEIADLLGLSVRARLVHPEVKTPEVLAELNALSEDQVLSEIIELTRQRVRENPSAANTLTAAVQLFAWLVKRNRTVKLDGFPAFTLHEPGEKPETLILRAGAPASERPLAPIAVWTEAARPFVDLLPASAILHSRYAEVMKEAQQWQPLASNGFLHLSPLYETEATVQDFLPDEPLSDDEKKAELNSTATHRRTEVAFLSGDDRSIIGRARSSQTRALSLIHFILEYLLPADAHALDVEAAKCNTGAEHRFFPANWLTPLRRRVWVPIGDKKSEPPSAESLAILLAKESALLKRMGEERVSQFLKAIGVSPADLMLRSVGRDDPERVSLIQSLSVITTAAGNDPERVKALAGAIQQDPEILTLVEDRRARQETVKRNQALGQLVEDLFVEAFKGTGIRPKRTGPGHDYRIIPAAGEEDDAAQIEIAGPAGPVFVEIKATTTTEARMSVKQVSEAVPHKDHYFLCVLASTDTHPDVEAFKAKARFVTDIGQRFEYLWSEYLSMKMTLDLTQKTEGGLAIELSGQQVKFRVGEDVWIAGLDFSATLQLLKSRLLPPATVSG